MDLSDDIAYSVHDFEDAVVNGFIDVGELGARVDHAALVDAMHEWVGGSHSRDELMAAFDRLDCQTRDGETILVGSLDQAALRGLLVRLCDLGIQVVSVNPADRPDAALSARSP